ncbi:MAG: hypothetical protein SWK90_14240 [Chloroflexota bacterium]|nr:hypothetical protein [Chloroflexota bacterium]
MNVREVVRGLKGCEGYEVCVRCIQVNIHSEMSEGEHTQDCVRVEHLPVDQRRVDQGNVILWDGRVEGEGLPAGVTFWARDVVCMFWSCDDVVRLLTRQGVFVSIVRLRKMGGEAGGIRDWVLEIG